MSYQPRSLLLLLGLTVGCHANRPANVVVAPYTVLPETAIESARTHCSRPTPEFDATWAVDEATIGKLEQNLHRLHRLKAKGCCLLRFRVRDPWLYHRQYLGVVMDGRRLVYINAFRVYDDRLPTSWRQQAVDTCDGGDYYWGVLYDPSTGRFFNLAANGEA